MAKTIVLVTGGFDPLHSGHIEYFNAAKRLGDILVVGLNSDEWLTRKKGKPFLSFFERNEIVIANYPLFTLKLLKENFKKIFSSSEFKKPPSMFKAFRMLRSSHSGLRDKFTIYS